MQQYDVALIGSGFASTILARVLHRLGLRVVLLERERHPRFAIGESSTPLGALCLERLAKRYGLADLSHLAAHGRWLEHLPQLRRGLKRGFTFYAHERGLPYRNGPDNDRRLLVAASPDDAVADTHWLRQDVDHFLVQRAVAEGVEFFDRTEVSNVESAGPEAWSLSARRGDSRFTLRARILVDGSGAGGFLPRQLAIGSALDRVTLDTALVFSHFDAVGDFAEIARAGGAHLTAGPYPDERAAVHHLLTEGWLYVLPFDHGTVSAGLLLRRQSLEELLGSGIGTAEGIWGEVVGRYPTLAEQFGGATPVRPIELVPRVQWRWRQAAGQGWALLPHTFCFSDPMFSTGIAWSLLAVERLARLFEEAGDPTAKPYQALASGLERYGRLLEAESDQILRLLAGAYLAMNDFPLFTLQSFLYFALVSFEEVDQRLRPEGRRGVAPAWRGFLGAADPAAESSFGESVERLTTILRRGAGAAVELDRRSFRTWVERTIGPRNVAGLADPARNNLYPVDLDLLVARAGLLGLTAQELRANLDRLRGRA